jgi:hypothetical protein
MGGNGPSDWKTVGRKLADELENVPPDKQISYIRGKVEELPEEMREAVSHFVTAVLIAAKQGAVSMPGPQPTPQQPAWEKILAVVLGVLFMAAIIVLAVFFPNPTSFQYQVFRIVLAIAVAGFAATIPGFLQIQLSNWLKAGGALAVFCVVYFYNPAQIVTEVSSRSSASPPVERSP